MYLIKDLWYGEVSLAKTYWLFGVVVGIFFNVIFTYIEFQPNVSATFFGQILVLGLVVFAFLYSIFICVAIWRSANKYQGLLRYAILAKVAVIFGVFGIIKTMLEIFGTTPSG